MGELASSSRFRGSASAVAGVVGFASNTKPGASSSCTVAVRVAERFVYSLFEAVLAAWVTTTVSWTPSLSCTAVRVTVWAVLQVFAVNVSADVPTATAPASALVMVTVTVALGSVARRSV